MDSITISFLIDDIVDAVYPERNAIRERYMLARSLNVLVSMATREPSISTEESEGMVQAMIEDAKRKAKVENEVQGGLGE